jgi:hypothetical protein
MKLREHTTRLIGGQFIARCQHYTEETEEQCNRAAYPEGLCYDHHTEKVLAEYRKAQAKRTPEQLAEEAFELRAAFGEGVEVVNVVTGKRTRT